VIETEGYHMENALNSSHSIAAMTETVPENGRGVDPRWQHPAEAHRRHGGGRCDPVLGRFLPSTRQSQMVRKFLDRRKVLACECRWEYGGCVPQRLRH